MHFLSLLVILGTSPASLGHRAKVDLKWTINVKINYWFFEVKYFCIIVITPKKVFWASEKILRHFWKHIASLVWYLLCGQVTLKCIAKNLSVCSILRNRCAVFSFVPSSTQKVGIIKCNFLQARWTGWSRGSRASRSSTGPSSTSWRSLTGLRKKSFYLFQLWGFQKWFLFFAIIIYFKDFMYYFIYIFEKKVLGRVDGDISIKLNF